MDSFKIWVCLRATDHARGLRMYISCVHRGGHTYVTPVSLRAEDIAAAASKVWYGHGMYARGVYFRGGWCPVLLCFAAREGLS